MVEESKKISKKKTAIGCGVLVAIFIILAVSIGTCLGGEEEAPIAPRVPPEKPQLTSVEQAYATTIVNQTTTVGKALTNLSSLLQNPKYGNDEWTLQVAVQLTTIRLVYDEAMALEPPSSMVEIHLKYTQGMKAYNDMTYLFSRGVDELDPNLIDQAVTKMETGIQLINEATELVLEFRETYK